MCLPLLLSHTTIELIVLNVCERFELEADVGINSDGCLKEIQKLLNAVFATESHCSSLKANVHRSVNWF